MLVKPGEGVVLECADCGAHFLLVYAPRTIGERRTKQAKIQPRHMVACPFCGQAVIEEKENPTVSNSSHT